MTLPGSLSVKRFGDVAIFDCGSKIQARDVPARSGPIGKESLYFSAAPMFSERAAGRDVPHLRDRQKKSHAGLRATSKQLLP